MKRHYYIIFAILFVSCKSYLDNRKYSDRKFDSFKIEKLENYSKLTYQSKIGASADTEKYFPQHFEISLPKKIKSWSSSNTANFVEYGKNQIVAIDAGFINEKLKVSPWKIINDDEKTKYYLQRYYNIKKKNFDWDKKLFKYKIFTDGKAFIMFYNLEKHSQIFENIVNSFNYTNL